MLLGSTPLSARRCRRLPSLHFSPEASPCHLWCWVSSLLCDKPSEKSLDFSSPFQSFQPGDTGVDSHVGTVVNTAVENNIEQWRQEAKWKRQAPTSPHGVLSRSNPLDLNHKGSTASEECHRLSASLGCPGLADTNSANHGVPISGDIRSQRSLSPAGTTRLHPPRHLQCGLSSLGFSARGCFRLGSNPAPSEDSSKQLLSFSISNKIYLHL